LNGVTRFLFDENTGAPFVNVLRSIAPLDKKHTVEIAHTVERFGLSAKDREWVPKLEQEDWIVISEDRGMHSSRGDKLPVLCWQYNVTHVLVLPALLKNGGQFEKLRALLAMWPRLLLLPNEQRGSRWKLKYANPERTQFRLDLKPMAPFQVPLK